MVRVVSLLREEEYITDILGTDGQRTISEWSVEASKVHGVAPGVRL